MPLIFLSVDAEKPPENEDLAVLHLMGCKLCPLADCGAHSPDMRPSGTDRPLVYVLGEAPGRVEDDRDQPFVGESGEFLWRCMPRELSMENVRLNNCVRTRPPGNETPSRVAVEHCRPSVVRDIEATRPPVVVAVGGVALTWATGAEGINANRGRIIAAKIGDHVCWVVPILHPAGIMRLRDGEEDTTLMRLDLQRAYAVATKWDPPIIENAALSKEGVDLILGAGRENADRIVRRLHEYRVRRWVSVDIETASNEKLKARKLRPYGEGARILSISLSDGDKTLAFALNHAECPWSKEDKARIEEGLKDFLCDDAVHKIAHKATFELEWLTFFYGVEIACARTPWEDSLIQAMTLDERRSGFSLEDACAQQLGLAAMKSLVPIDRTQMEQYDLKSLLLYNAMDTKYDVRLFQAQDDALSHAGLLEVYRERRSHVPTLVLAQAFGLQVDQNRVAGHFRRLSKEIRTIEETLHRQPSILRYEREFGAFNWGSPQQVFKWIDRTLDHRTKLRKKEGAADEEVLKELTDPAAPIILKLRTVSRLRSTYCESLMLPSGKSIYADGRIHTNFNLDVASTGRLSSTDPNVQNYPARSNKELRDQIIALSKAHRDYIWKLMGIDPCDCVILSADYGAIEARVIAMASRCRVLTKAMRTNYDIHMDWTVRLAEVFPALIGGKQNRDSQPHLKKLRTLVKNQWVFPAFYGARLESVAMFLGGVDVRKLEPLFRDFWREFQDVKEWQDWVVDFYDSHGYVETLNGLRRHGPMNLNQKVNAPVQGTACEIVLDAMDRLSERARRTNDWWLQARLNVHDDLTFYLPKASFERYHDEIVEAMLDVRFDFLNVPLCIETKAGPDWHALKEIGVFYQSRDQVPLWRNE